MLTLTRATLSLHAVRRYSAIQRAASLLLGVWLGLFASEPGLVHSCPLHDVAAAADAGASLVGHTGGTHGVASAPSRASGHDSAPAPSPGSHRCCTCPGACCPGTAVRVADPIVVAPARVLLVPASTLFGRERVVRLGGSHVALPPATGPPALPV